MRSRTAATAIFVIACLLSACVGGKPGGGGSSTYPVSGRVVYETQDGKPAANIRMQLIGATQSSVYTDAEGRWEAVFNKKNRMVVPYKEGFEFEPSSRTVDGAADDIDFIAKCVLPSYTVDGFVQDLEGNRISGVIINFESEIKDYEPVTTGDDGSWVKTGLQGTVKVIPSYRIIRLILSSGK